MNQQTHAVAVTAFLLGLLSRIGQRCTAASHDWSDWRSHRHVRETDAIGGLSAHMLSDMGALDTRTASVEPDTWSRVFDAEPRSLLAASLVATAMQAWACEGTLPHPAGTTAANEAVVGVFNGEFVNGAPVYRLPPIAVVATRKTQTDPAHAESVDRAKQVRTKTTARPPA
jgi:hypothetical protein